MGGANTKSLGLKKSWSVRGYCVCFYVRFKCCTPCYLRAVFSCRYCRGVIHEHTETHSYQLYYYVVEAASIINLDLTPWSPQCVTSHARQAGIQSSLHMPDKVLNFVKDHFLMDSVIRSPPLLLKRNVRYTQIAVHKIQGMERAYDVLFIGTGSHRRLHHQRFHFPAVFLRDSGFMCYVPKQPGLTYPYPYPYRTHAHKHYSSIESCPRAR